MSSQIKDFPAPITDNFLAEMERTGWTNLQAAQAIGVSERQVTRWRGGQVPRYAFVRLIAEAFGRETEWFYTDHTSGPSERAA